MRRALAGQPDCMLWSPRELLLHYLARIAAGENFTGMLVAHVTKLDDETIKTGASRAQLRCLETVGLLEAVKFDLMESE
jgi:hypothetical protein